MRADVIIPAYNEEERIELTLSHLYKVDWINQIIVVDDGSNDNTGKIARKYANEFICHDWNKGKTEAVISGLKKSKGEWIVLLDADLGETVTEGKKLLTPLINGAVDMTVAVLPQQCKKGFGLMKKRAQSILYKEASYKMNAPLSGQRGFHQRWLPLILQNKSYRFGFEMYLNLLFLQHGGVIHEVATNMNHRATGKDIKGLLHRGKQWLEMEITYGIIRH